MTEEVYRLVKFLPREETYSLSDQMRRAAVSIPSNIAEGCHRDTDRDFKHFLHIARGSTAELETQVQLCLRLKYFSKEEANCVIMLIEEVSKMLNAFIRKLTANS